MGKSIKVLATHVNCVWGEGACECNMMCLVSHLIPLDVAVCSKLLKLRQESTAQS